MEAEKTQMRQAMESSLKREWEVKADLEIKRLVNLKIAELQKEFEQAVEQAVDHRVEMELQKRSSIQSSHSSKGFSSSTSIPTDDVPLSSVSTNEDVESPSSLLDLSSLSVDSPEPAKQGPVKRGTRTPFSRAQTMFAGQPALGTPMDVDEPSPIAIANLGLSPRRNGATKAPSIGRNIFAVPGAEARWQPTLTASDDDEDASDDDLPVQLSPTRPKSSKNPFKPASGRPPLISQKTAPLGKPISQPNIFKAATAPALPTLSAAPDLRAPTSNAPLKERSSSPNRRISKIPSSTNLLSQENVPISPTRKTSVNKGKNSDSSDLGKVAAKNAMVKNNSAGSGAPRGRSIVELAQARAGGRALVPADGTRSPEPKGRAFAQRMADRREAPFAGKRSTSPPIWDPEACGDEMPSPFIRKSRKI